MKRSRQKDLAHDVARQVRCELSISLQVAMSLHRVVNVFWVVGLIFLLACNSDKPSKEPDMVSSVNCQGRNIIGVEFETVGSSLTKDPVFENALRSSSELSLSTLTGLRIRSVGPNLPAGAAGIQPGDVLLKYGGKTFSSRDELIEIVNSIPAGEPTEVELLRGIKVEKLSVSSIPLCDFINRLDESRAAEIPKLEDSSEEAR